MLTAVPHRTPFLRKYPPDRLADSGPEGISYDIFHMWTVPASQDVLQCFDQIACVHMFGLLVRSHTNAGQDGFRDESSIHNNDLVEGHWKIRDSSRRGSIDHTTCFVLQVLASAHHGCS